VSQINQKLVDYVKNALSQGHNLASIKAFLLKNNVSSHELDEVMAIFSAPQQANTIDDQIKAYISTQLRNGYSTDSIKQSLLQQGFSKYLIEKLIRQDNVINVRHEVHVSGKTIFGIFFGLIILGALGYAVFYTGIFMTKELPLLDSSIELNKYSFTSDDSISYTITLISMGSKNRFDAKIQYIILDASGKSMKTYSETIAVDTKTSSTGKISLQGLTIGSYVLKAVVEYGGASDAESSIGFDIVNSNEQIPNIPIDQTPTTPNAGITPANTTNNIIVSGPPDIVNVGPTDTFGDSLNIIRNQAKVNPSVAANNCAKFTSSDQKDVCFANIADASGKPNYCDIIKSVSYRDNCYLAFVISGNTIVCDKIYDNSTLEYCNQIKLVNLMNQYYQQGNTDKVIELSKQFKPDLYNSNPAPASYNNVLVQKSTYSVMDINIKIDLNNSGNQSG
jgi:hypothetical protein